MTSPRKFSQLLPQWRTMFGTCSTGALAPSVNGIQLLISERCKLPSLIRDDVVGSNVAALVVKAFLPH